MSVLINADTSDGLKLTSDTSGEIKLQSAGTDIATVTANGIDVTGDFTVDTNTLYVDATNNRVGIGTTSPDTALTVAGEVRSLDGTVSTYITSASGAGGYIGTRSNDYLSFQTNATDRMRVRSNGYLSIGCTSSPNASTIGVEFVPVLTSDWCKFSAGSTGGIRAIGFYNPNGLVGDITTNGSGTLFNTSSDYRLKENNVNITDGISRVKLLKPYRFNFIADASVTVDGFFAHEVQDVVPEAITKTKDAMRTEEYEITPAVLDDDDNVVTEAVMGTREVPDYQGIDQAKLVPLLTAALQEAITKIEDLETRIQALENA
jgi:hypothetical protein